MACADFGEQNFSMRTVSKLSENFERYRAVNDSGGHRASLVL